ncbi:hypothetical protein GMO_24060 [Gluconobacter morbifer G707]|uniref:Uncharacterized protein n=1 Tax=Gluconobacter morbifer G707 TaxID=1088869 RepID=G6XM06_9PROT|nr:hypothetical protein GMO_24060 [Gluconobacter morbifer G707]
MDAVPVTRISSGAAFETIDVRRAARDVPVAVTFAGGVTVCLRIFVVECVGVFARAVEPNTGG